MTFAQTSDINCLATCYTHGFHGSYDKPWNVLAAYANEMCRLHPRVFYMCFTLAKTIKYYLYKSIYIYIHVCVI